MNEKKILLVRESNLGPVNFSQELVHFAVAIHAC